MGKEPWRRALAEVRAAATAAGRARLSALSLEGTRLFERALRAGARLERAVVSASYRAAPGEREQRLLDELERAGCEVCVAPDEALREVTEGRGLGDVVGLAPLPTPPSVEALFGARARPWTLLAAVEVEEPGNVGALARTALASGSLALAAVGRSDPFHPKAVRTSMGAVLRLPVLRFASTSELLDACRAHGVATVAAVSSGGAPLPELCLGGEAAVLLLGSEAFGLDDATRAAATHRVSIPMPGEVDSLSVNAAAAVLLYALATAPR
jgi:TrmH family RNA methyltransferase